MVDQKTCFEGAAFLKEQTAGLYEPHGSKSLGESAERSSKQNREIAAAIPHWQGWREAANGIKAYAIANLDRLLVEFERNITARGATVLYAEKRRRGQPLCARHRPGA